MKVSNFLIIGFSFCLVSCKSLKHNDSIISYNYILEGIISPKIVGDFQEIEFLRNKILRVMPGYFRNFGSKSESLIVRISVEKKYGFQKLAQVKSRQFGKLNLTNHEWQKKDSKFDDLIYQLPLSDIDLAQRMEKIFNDTITVKFGNANLLFSPRK